MVDSADPRRWFRRALHDLKSATYDLENEPDELADVICFASHQASEKALKGFLLAKDSPALRSHDLIQLLDLACAFGPILSAFKASVTKLNEYSRDARYPADIRWDFGGDEAQGAHIAATTLVGVLIELSGVDMG